MVDVWVSQMEFLDVLYGGLIALFGCAALAYIFGFDID